MDLTFQVHVYMIELAVPFHNSCISYYFGKAFVNVYTYYTKERLEICDVTLTTCVKEVLCMESSQAGHEML